MFIYKFTNPKNNKVYIGLWSKSLRELKARYTYELKNKKNRPIVNAINKAGGLENFKFEIIKDDVDTREQLLSLEKTLISQHLSFSNGYNLTKGGEGTQLFGKDNPNYGKAAWNRGKKLSLETREKMSVWQKGQPKSASHKAAIKLRGLNQRIKISQEQENELVFLYIKGEDRESICQKIKLTVGPYRRIIKDLIVNGGLIQREQNTIFEENYGY